MPLQELKLVIGSEKAEELAEALLEQGALSVGIEDAYANTPDEQALYDEPHLAKGTQTEIQLWDNSLILTLFKEGVEVEAIVKNVLQNLCIHVQSMQVSEVADKDWVRLTQSQFESIPVSNRLWIVPSWIQLNHSVAHKINLDPGLAFGTGSHPTTFLCLTWLDKNLQQNQSVLDYGCGSGILAIAAKKLGANPVIGVDLDEQAILASRENAAKNNVKINFYLPNEFQFQKPFDIVVANILANPLKLLASMLASYIVKGGKIVLSGILKQQEKELIVIYQEWFEMDVYQEKEGWVCLVGIKK